MTRLSQLTLAAFFAAFLAVIGMAPAAQAASIPAGGTVSIEQAGKVDTQQVWHRRRYYRRHYYRPRYVYRRTYYRRPVYYGRRCWTRPRLVWTPYGYVRRYVRVCR